METKLIIIEGMDNTGKSTIIDKLVKTFSGTCEQTKVIHSEKPPKHITKKDAPVYMHNYYLQLINTITEIKNSGKYGYIILDRAWLSEYVYGQIYRDRDGIDIIRDNEMLDKKVISIFGSDNVNEFVLLASNDFLIAHEDNLSLSKCDPELLNKERKLFKEASVDALLNRINLDVIEVNDGLNFKDIFLDILEKII